MEKVFLVLGIASVALLGFILAKRGVFTGMSFSGSGTGSSTPSSGKKSWYGYSITVPTAIAILCGIAIYIVIFFFLIQEFAPEWFLNRYSKVSTWMHILVVIGAIAWHLGVRGWGKSFLFGSIGLAMLYCAWPKIETSAGGEKSAKIVIKRWGPGIPTQVDTLSLYVMYSDSLNCSFKVKVLEGKILVDAPGWRQPVTLQSGQDWATQFQERYTGLVEFQTIK